MSKMHMEIGGVYDKSPLFWMVIYQKYYEIWGYIRIYLMGEGILEVSSPWEYGSICPFYDGNGRTGRLLLNYELLRNNLAPVVIPKEQRGDYFVILEHNDSAALVKFLEELSRQEQERINSMPKGEVN